MNNINKQSRTIILIVCITVVFSLMVLPAFAGKGGGKSSTDLSNSNMSWLYVYVTFENLTSDTQLYVDLYSPDGYLYQTLNTAVLAGSVDGYVNLPFGNGTWTSRLIGQWKAEVRFDNNSNVSGRDFFNLTD